jgi:hypothetical protein
MVADSYVPCACHPRHIALDVFRISTGQEGLTGSTFFSQGVTDCLPSKLLNPFRNIMLTFS